MESDRKQSLVSVILHTVIGIAVGYLSLLVGGFVNALGLAVVVLIVLAFSLKKVLKISKDKKWWIGNGIVVYIFIWFVSWVLFFNLLAP